MTRIPRSRRSSRTARVPASVEPSSTTTISAEKRERAIDGRERHAFAARAQPIVMTTVAMVAGMLPTAISLSGDNSWRAPMGITVIGGLIFSTILTLLLVPAYFSIAIDVAFAVPIHPLQSIGSTAP